MRTPPERGTFLRPPNTNWLCPPGPEVKLRDSKIQTLHFHCVQILKEDFRRAQPLRICFTSIFTRVMMRRVKQTSDSRWLAADLAVVPLLAVGEIFLIGVFNLLHGADVGSEREERCTVSSLSFNTVLHL